VSANKWVATASDMPSEVLQLRPKMIATEGLRTVCLARPQSHHERQDDVDRLAHKKTRRSEGAAGFQFCSTRCEFKIHT